MLHYAMFYFMIKIRGNGGFNNMHIINFRIYKGPCHETKNLQNGACINPPAFPCKKRQAGDGGF
jgi:hypothetical protein